MTADGFLSSPIFVDLVVLGLVFVSGILSYGRRFSGEFCSLLNWVGALLFLYFSYPYWDDVLGSFLNSRDLGFLVVIGGFFLLVFAILYIFTGMLARTLQRHVASKFDRGLGLFYGFFRGLIIVCVIFGFLRAFAGEELAPRISESFTLPYIFLLTEASLDFLRTNLMTSV